jgi:DNA helicase-2/ATP-dependent DNA helicase PcrA
VNSPTPEQWSVIDSKARVRMVEAVPGSGKTWLIAELIKEELKQWQGEHQGIAALSFTRVGGEEIRRAVGHNLSHPHFVGTLDAFVFRFIVRPFLRHVFPGLSLPRLLPAEWEPKEWHKRTGGAFITAIGTGTNVKVYNLFQAYFCHEEKEQFSGKNIPMLSYKARSWEPMRKLDAETSKAVREAKQDLWKKNCMLTHSDAAMLASIILEHRTHGVKIRSELLSRFPLIVVDELQDTGWFLGKSILQLLSEPAARGVLVGDPDQAIFEFSGARPDLFYRFSNIPGVTAFPLTHTRRCAGAVCSVAIHLAQSKREIASISTQSHRALLLYYNELESDIRRLRDLLLTRYGGKNVKIVARLNKTVDTITGVSAKEAPKLGSVPLNHWHRAVNRFRCGRQSSAFAASRAALEHVVFGNEGVTDAEVHRREVSPVLWKRCCIEILLEANKEIVGETFEAWGKRLVEFVRVRLTDVIPKNSINEEPVRIGLPRGKMKTRARKHYLCAVPEDLPGAHGVSVQTVHSVKGQTHDLTVLVCPGSKDEKDCPSVVWWSDDDADKEEKRIAFVAVTRTRGDLIVCVSEQSYTRLCNHRPGFIKAFECMSVESFIAETLD